MFLVSDLCHQDMEDFYDEHVLWALCGEKQATGAAAFISACYYPHRAPTAPVHYNSDVTAS